MAEGQSGASCLHWGCFHWHRIRLHEASEAYASITRALQNVYSQCDEIKICDLRPLDQHLFIEKKCPLCLVFHILHDDSKQWCRFRPAHPEVGNRQTLLPASRGRKARVSIEGSGSQPGKLPVPGQANACQFYKEDGAWYVGCIACLPLAQQPEFRHGIEKTSRRLLGSNWFLNHSIFVYVLGRAAKTETQHLT